MHDDNQALHNPAHKPVVVRPGRSIDEILRYVDRAPDQETERFVAAIYADRREFTLPSPSE